MVASAHRAEQAEAFYRCDIEIQAVDRDDAAVALAKRSDAKGGWG